MFCLPTILCAATLNAAEIVGSPTPKAPTSRPAFHSPLELDEAGRAWARRMVVQAAGSDRQRLHKIHSALIDPQGLDLQESSDSTPTALEALRTRRANCVGFALLFVAVAREAGIPAFFAMVEDGRADDLGNGLRLVQEHLTAAVRIRDKVWLIDFAGIAAGKRAVFHSISDLTAISIFHSNRGIEHLRRGFTEQAIIALETAVELDPELPDAWVNLGVAHRWAEHWSQAERAYRKALALEPGSPSAAKNLVILLELSGRHEESAAIKRRLGHEVHADPLRLLQRAEQSLAGGRLDEARRLYARALDLSAR